MKKVRVRFAPSPTGPLHIGGMRTALYNYLFAKGQDGDFILRIEDTDTTRLVEGAEQYIMKALEWSGIIPDECPEKGGKYAPYRQSERRDIYDKYKELILKTDHAYLAFDTEEELQDIRKETEEKGGVFSYNHETRIHLRNSISLSKNEVQSLLHQGVPYVVRFKVPENQNLVLQDMIRGSFSVNTSTLDDKVLVKSDGMPTYHFANIVDDHEMEITHVIRGEEWLSSMPLHILLYKAIGCQAPQFAHLPLLLKPEGKGKLSKRDGDKYHFPVFPIRFEDKASGSVLQGYREEGFLPDAFINMLALLGWSPGDDREILSMEEMLQEFNLNKVQKSGARFSIDKAKWFNQQYLQKKKDEDILPSLKPLLSEKGINLHDEQLLRIIKLMKERLVFVKDVYQEGLFFFQSPEKYDEKATKRAWDSNNTPTILSKVSEKLEHISFDAEEIRASFQSFLEAEAIPMPKLMMPLRLSLTGNLQGPEVADLMSIIGKEESLQRIKKAIEALK